MCPLNALSVSAAAKLQLLKVLFVLNMKNLNQTWCGDNERWFVLTLELMYPAVADKTRLVCDTCELGKRTRSSYIYSGMRSNMPFHTIHSDVWGPCSTASLNGYQWFLTFIDWRLYVMKNKSHVYSCFAIKQWWTSIMHNLRCLNCKQVVEVMFNITIINGKKSNPIIWIPFHLERRIWLLIVQLVLLHP